MSDDHVILRVTDRPVEFGGHMHSGWLPASAVLPERTPRRTVCLEIRILGSGGGYILDWRPLDETIEAVSPFASDNWYEDLDFAIAEAQRLFGIEQEDWEKP